MIRNKRYLLLITSLLVFAVIPIQGCNSATDNGKQKLSSILNKLVQAEERGEVEEFAHQKGIELLYDDAGLVSVRVEIDCESGQVEAAIKVIETYGTVEVSYLDTVQAVVPITSLAALADAEESIVLIRLPIYAE